MDLAVNGRWARSRASVPAKTWTLALLQGTSAVGLAGMAAAPLGGAAPMLLYAACAVALAVMTLALVAVGACLGDRALLALAGARVLIVAVAVAGARSGGATLFAGAGLVWVALWVTAFYQSRVVLLMAAAEVAAVSLAVLVNADHLRTVADTTPMLIAALTLSLLMSQVLSSLRHEARHDQLTDLLNRRGLDQALRELSGRRLAGLASMVAIDLDGLKAVNDRGGHLAGDQMLLKFASELQTAARGVDLVARIGGDEFIVILPGLSATEATLWAAQLRGRSDVPWSFGVAERGPGESFEPWLVRADQRMYTAKAAARARRVRPVPVPALA